MKNFVAKHTVMNKRSPAASTTRVEMIAMECKLKYISPLLLFHVYLTHINTLDLNSSH